MLLAVVWRVVVAVPLGYVFLVLLYYLFSRHRAQLLLYYLTSHVCLRFRGCAVVLGIELSVSARHQKTRVPLCARRLVLLLVAAAASGGVRHKLPNYMH